VGRVHAHLTPPGLEDQPTRASARRILDVGPAEDVAKKCARCGGIVGINQGVNAGDHQTELLKSPEFYSLGLPPIKNPVVVLEIEIRTLRINRSRIRHAPAFRADGRLLFRVAYSSFTAQ
jgi:hypothetical protein